MNPSKSYRTRRFRRNPHTSQRVAALRESDLELGLLATRIGVGVAAEQPPVDYDGTLSFEADSGSVRARLEGGRIKSNTKTQMGFPRPGARDQSAETTGEYAKPLEDGPQTHPRPLLPDIDPTLLANRAPLSRTPSPATRGFDNRRLAGAGAATAPRAQQVTHRELPAVDAALFEVERTPGPAPPTEGAVPWGAIVVGALFAALGLALALVTLGAI